MASVNDQAQHDVQSVTRQSDDALDEKKKSPPAPLENGHESENSEKNEKAMPDSRGDHRRQPHHHHQHQPSHKQLKKQSSHRRKSRRSSTSAAASTSASDDRPMGHYPPRPESRQESPPTAFVDTTAHTASPLQESWSELSSQFEESVGKPSREALHKFFYPPGNNIHMHSPHQSPHRRSSSSRAGHNVSSSSSSPGKQRAKKRSSSKKHHEALAYPPLTPPTAHAPTTATERNEDSEFNHETSDEATKQPSIPQQSQPPQHGTTSHSAAAQQQNGQHHDDLNISTDPEEEQEPPAILRQQTIHRSLSGSSSIDSFPNNNNFVGTSPITPTTNNRMQQSFDAEEEADRKYVERFWTTYDDIVMLSLFTQLGVVARLAASTWFTFFDGVFHKESPLFTNLPLNCFSCFLLGLLGSGDRLMETITTRFTPRHLQQSIVQDYSRGTEYYEYENTNDDDDDSCNSESNYYCGADDDLHMHSTMDDDDGNNHSGGLRRRRRRRRSKRSKRRIRTFHSWQPPLHWHDDLREVQLLALERRIRASKCLLLFPVAKEDADVMEHYFGEGYKASDEKQRHYNINQQQRASTITTRNHKRRRRKFGRQRYAATNLADTDDDLDNSHDQEGGRLQNSDDSEDEYPPDDINQLSRISSKDDSELSYDDGLFRFDLELTESTEVTPAKQSTTVTNLESPAAASESSIPSCVQRLIKRSPPGQRQPAIHQTHPVPLPGSIATTRETSHGQDRQGFAPCPPNDPAGAASSLQHPNGNGGVARPVEPQAPSRVSPTDNSDAGSDNGASTTTALSGGEGGDPQIDQIISNVQANVSEKISRLGRVNLADGWDVGTTPEAMCDDLMLGLRDGFCGALSSFSSWNSSMLNLLREGHIGEAFVGYLLGIQLPIVAYRFGQQVAVYSFVWRARREARREARKGWYGIRVKMDGSDDESDDQRRDGNNSSGEASSMEEYFDDRSRDRSAEASFEDDAMSRETPSVRAICTALYLLALVTQFTSLNFFANPEDQQVALSLLFSPVGTLTRWRLSKLNVWRPGFPIGTFACNILACALSGSLGSILAGNPGPRERIFLQSLIAGFGGTLSSLATFIVEILAGMDPLLFRFDGVIYAVCSIFWAMTIGFVFSASVDWADETS